MLLARGRAFRLVVQTSRPQFVVFGEAVVPLREIRIGVHDLLPERGAFVWLVFPEQSGGFVRVSVQPSG
ncbi:MAG: hypothetical protein ABI051_19050 [Vicinamibacterales bacterium]